MRNRLNNADPNKNPDKYRKYVERERRLMQLLPLLRNGQRQSIVDALYWTQDRLQQLSKHHPAQKQQQAKYDADGNLVFYSYGVIAKTHQYNRALMENPIDEEPSDASLIYDVECIMQNILGQIANMRADKMIDRADALWEQDVLDNHA